MLRCASVYTHEIDDSEAALAELMDQLDTKIDLLKNSVGIIMCHPEFIATGITKYVGENLPFDIVGITTASQAVNDDVNEHVLTLFVMTSDDAWFKAGITESLYDEIDAPTMTAYSKAAAGESEPPKLAIIFPPFLIERYAGDAFVNVLSKIIPDTPFFGTVAIDDTVTFKECETIYNGEHKKDAMSFVLCYGNIDPHFYIVTLPENESISLRAEVTKSKDNVVHEINNINARVFYAQSGIPESMITVPFMIDLKKRTDYDGIPVISANNFFTEDGAAVFSCHVEEGSTFSLANFTIDDVLTTTQQGIKKITGLKDVSGALLFPCVIRRIPLMGIGKPLAELQIAQETLKIPFMMGYSGGEICPTSVKNSVPTNRFHNYSIIILVL
jgi:hypothetical protein